MKKFILVFTILFFANQAFAFTPPNIPVEIAIYKLKTGNERFVDYKMKHPDITKERREKLVNGQHPFAVILACSDSRIVPEIIFDQGLGDILVIRTPGNILDDNALGTIQYAIKNFGVNLVIVMGHESCDVVGAAIKDEKPGEAFESIKNAIKPAILKCSTKNKYSFDNVIRTNTQLAVNILLENKEIAEYSKRHDIKILPAYYNIGTGKVEFLK